MTAIIEKELVYKIVGCAIKVYNELGCGLRGQIYERGNGFTVNLILTTNEISSLLSVCINR